MLIIATAVLMISSQVAKSQDIPEAKIKTKHDGMYKEPFFQAHLSSDGIYNSTNEVILYDAVTLNRQNAYNKTSGVFVCPSTGVYRFTVEAHLRQDSPVNAEVRLVTEHGMLKVWLGYVLRIQTRSINVECLEGGHVLVLQTKGQDLVILKAGYNSFSGERLIGDGYPRKQHPTDKVNTTPPSRPGATRRPRPGPTRTARPGPSTTPEIKWSLPKVKGCKG